MKNILKNEIEFNESIKQANIEKDLGMNKATVSNVVNQSTNAELHNVLKIVRYVIPEREREYMSEYLLTLDKPNKMIEAIEYTSTNRMFETFKVLLDKMKSSDKKKLKQYGEVYNLVYEFQMQQYDPYELRFKIRGLGTNRDDHQNLLIDMLDSYIMYGMEQYKAVESTLVNTYDKLKQVKDSYLTESLSLRASQLLCHVSLIVNCDECNCRKYSDKLISSSIGNSYVGYGYFMKGMSYIYESYDQAISHFNEALSTYKESMLFSNVKATKDKINLLKLYWGKPVDIDATNESTAESCLIRGILHNDSDLLKESCTIYLSKNDAWMSRVSKNILTNKGEDVTVLDMIYKNKIAL